VALAAVARDLDVHLHAGHVAAIDGAGASLALADGTRVGFDAALVAVGARPLPWLEGALTFTGPAETAAFGRVLARIEAGVLTRLAFVAPGDPCWTLPMYELALLTASRIADAGLGEVELTVVTPEPAPLAALGPGATRLLRDELVDRGIRLRAEASALAFADGRLRLSSGEELEADAVVALPRLVGPEIAGLPSDDQGFVLVDDRFHALVPADVYAVGDGAAYPLKQGGIAAQQADLAAEWIAAGLGVPLQPRPFEPRLRAILLTGVAPMYMRSRAGADAARGPELSADTLWWPPVKIAGRRLAPYLAEGRDGEAKVLRERRPGSPDPTVEHARREALELGLELADADADAGDFDSALAWLEIVEQIDGALPEAYAEKRPQWRSRAAAPPDRVAGRREEITSTGPSAPRT
jgi:sulfide:quinone oxidoreductase